MHRFRNKGCVNCTQTLYVALSISFQIFCTGISRMLRVILNKSWRQHPTRHQLYGHLPSITKTIQVRRTRHAGHCWRSRDELISEVLLWTPTYGRAKAGRPARTYIQQLCEDTGYIPEDLREAMNDREKWRERVRDISAKGTTRWWWLLYILWDDWPIFMISGSNEQLQKQLEYTLLKPDCHSWWISKIQWGHLKERYAIKFCIKLGKMPQKRMECFRLLFDHLAWIEHQFFSGIRDSRKAGSLWGMMGGVAGVRKAIHQSWLANGLGLGLALLCWGCKGVQEEIPSEEASTLQIGSVAFSPGQYSSPQLYLFRRLFDKDGH